MTDLPVGTHCPACHRPAAFGFPTQLWCGNDDCPIWSWDPTKTMDELLDRMSTVDLSGLQREPGE